MNIKRKLAAGLMATCLTAGLATGLTACGSDSTDGTVNLTFQIWDVFQRDGMQAMCDAYTAEHPNVHIEVQVTSWDEYWTKLEAGAISNQMPDIFWMHTNEILKYADYGKLADCSDIVETEHFSDISLANASGSDGVLYGVPKDKDTVGLVYNKEMFDAAGVAYPDETWTWDDLVSASEAIYEATGNYGYMAYADDQLGYWNFVYQAGGSILTEDKKHANFTDPGTKMGMEFYIGLQQNDWCPDQNYFAETAPGTAFFSEKGAMFFEGDWNILPELQNYPDMVGKWGVAVLPMCPNPVSGDGRATISNGLSYATSATNKHMDIVKDVLKFFGSEEGQRIQGESGAAIPAYEGLEDTWVSCFAEYPIDVTPFIDMFDYSIQSVNNAARPEWKSPVSDTLIKIYTGELSLDTGLEQMQNIVESASAEYYEEDA
ncbi:MAG TPA: sugar ABC transporter substrate-binding protein [Candidatus Gemmiger excrementavium]|uniref:Sugar ABC transporter substrate-binding protein n=1 Tax=Candidatus Gemmiger excrementavium TaxID=2838608 RepID=A0A9D2JG76_9FIRM|nr:sugar ABC transporter substrate-binding protein [Candidatus Gemmiger excrementavium]